MLNLIPIRRAVVEMKHAAGGLGIQIECEFSLSMVCNENITMIYTEKHVLKENKLGIIMQRVAYLQFLSDLRTRVATWK
jgi:hypothetical protein